MALDYIKIEKYISTPRLRRYEDVCNGGPKKALKLYQSNIRLSQSFYSMLSLLEVVLRNALNEELTFYFHDINWLMNQQDGFMSDPRLIYKHWRTGKYLTNDFLKSEVRHSIGKAKLQTHCKILADLKFGFWGALFQNTHFEILNGTPLRAFKNLPVGGNRQLIDDSLTRIRDFRNRIYHNEPIIFGKDSKGVTTFDLNIVHQVYEDIRNIFIWMGLDFNKWTIRINNISLEIKCADCVLSFYPTKGYYFRRSILGIKHNVQKYVMYNR